MLNSKYIHNGLLAMVFLLAGMGELMAQFPVNIGRIPAGKTITIMYEVTIDGDTPANTTEVCEQDTLTYDDPNNHGMQLGLVSDDPSVGGTEDPTCTDVQVCNITDITAGNRMCEPGSTTYSQEVMVTYVGGAGQLNVNGQLFAIGTSPQTVTLTGLPINGIPVNVTASFTGVANCFFTKLNVFQAPTLLTVDAGNDEMICLGDDAMLNAVANGGTPSYDYLWDDPGAQTTASITVTPTMTTTYSVTVTDDLGCEATDMVDVKVTAITDIVTFGDPVCNPNNTYNQTITVTYQGAPNTGSISANGVLYPIATSPQNLILTNLPFDGNPVDVTIFFTDMPDCELTVQDLFTAPLPLMVMASDDESICINDMAMLSASASQGSAPYTYSWEPGGLVGPNVTVEPTETTVYTVTATDAIGCEATDEVEVEVRKFPIDVEPYPELICDDTEPFKFKAYPEGGTWSGPGITNPSTGKFKPEVAGPGIHEIVYEVYDPNTDCTKSRTLEITVNQCKLKCVLYPYEYGEFSVWVQNVPGVEDDNYYFMGNGNQGGIGFMEIYYDGTARITGTLVNRSNPTIKWHVKFLFHSSYNWEEWKALGGRYKVNNQAMTQAEINLAKQEHVNWTYFMMDEDRSRLEGVSGVVDGVVLKITERSNKHRFQKGWAANDKDGDYGVSGWFKWAGEFNGEHWSGYGDINADIDCNEKPENDMPHALLRTMSVGSEEVPAPFSKAIGVEAGGKLNVNMDIEDREGEVSYTVEGLPSHVQIVEKQNGDQINLDFTWNAELADVGVHDVNIITVDKEGEINEREMRIEIADPGAFPQNFIHFSALKRNDLTVDLDWETGAELEGTRFIVETSRKNDIFTQYAEVKGSGNVKEGGRYYQHFGQVITGSWFFRIKQITPNGAFNYSETVKINVKDDETPELLVFPSPATKSLEVRLPVRNAGEYTLKIVDISGRQVYKKIHSMDAGLNSLNIDVSEIAEGVYMIFANGQSYKGMARFTKN